MEIQVVLKNQYGQEVVCPACSKSLMFCEIAGTKLMTRRTIDLVKKLGYRIVVIQTEPAEL